MKSTLEECAERAGSHDISHGIYNRNKKHQVKQEEPLFLRFLLHLNNLR